MARDGRTPPPARRVPRVNGVLSEPAKKMQFETFLSTFMATFRQEPNSGRVIYLKAETTRTGTCLDARKVVENPPNRYERWKEKWALNNFWECWRTWNAPESTQGLSTGSKHREPRELLIKVL